MQLSIGLALALVSAITVNWAYAREHDAAAAMPAFSPRRPVRFVSLLLRDRRWRAGFAAETGGWLVYVAALRLARSRSCRRCARPGSPCSPSRAHTATPGRLIRREQLATVVALAGLVLLAVSLVDTGQADHAPGWRPVLLWLGCSTLAALLLARLGAGLARGPALGLAAGLFFAGGDISAKLVVYGGIWLAAAASLIVCYGLGTSVLQGSFQHADALTGAGLATLATNAVPIAAGFVVFGEQLPGGVDGALQLAAFASLVAGAVLLSRPPRQSPRAAAASTASRLSAASPTASPTRHDGGGGPGWFRSPSSPERAGRSTA